MSKLGCLLNSRVVEWVFWRMDEKESKRSELETYVVKGGIVILMDSVQLN